MPSGRDVSTAPVTAGVSASADHGGARRPWPVTAGGSPGDEVRRGPASRPMRPCMEIREEGAAGVLRAR